MSGFFNQDTFRFLQQLRANNQRAWFTAHKADYERHVREPALRFIEAMQTPMAALSGEFPALARRAGGSLMRVHRDLRFSADKLPYKLNIGIQFRHRLGRDVHAPGFYLHIEPDECFLGAGIWRPDSRTLARIRAFLDDNPSAWRQALNHPAFAEAFELAGDSLKRPPRGYDRAHPLIEDLMRKDFIAIAPLAEAELLDPRLPQRTADRFRASAPLVRYLCAALELPF